MTRRLGAVASGVVLLAALAACSTTSSSGSRAKLYESLEGLAADSSAIVVGTVRGQRGGDGASVSSFEVTNAPANPDLGNALDGEHPPVTVGDVVNVRQVGEPYLETGVEYLLFLTPTMLPGDAAADYYITGAVAGLYARDGGDFRRVVVDSGDTSPETITIAE